MAYYLTNAIFGTCVLLMLAITSWTQRKQLKLLSIKTITLIAMFVALSVVLTNFIGYGISLFGIKIMFGNFIIFLCGVLFGPFFGIVSGFCSDLIGSLFIITGPFNFGYMLAKMIIGLMGGFVFFPKNNRFWQLRIVLYLSVGLAFSSFIVTPIASASTIGWELVLATYWKKFIIVPSEILIYTPIVFALTSISYVLLKSDITKISKPWFLKNNEVILFWQKKKI